jgi:hypothetical protein
MILRDKPLISEVVLSQNQNTKINHGDSKTLIQILFSTNDNLAKLC